MAINLDGSDMKDRIRKRRKELGLSQESLAKQLKLTKGSISQWEQGGTNPSGQNLLNLAEALNVRPQWLIDGIGPAEPAKPRSNEVEFFGTIDPWDEDTPLDEGEVELPLFREVEIAAGSGKTQVIENHGYKLRFAKRTLANSGVEKDNAACAYVSGDSMEPAMPDGTVVGVDTLDRSIKDGKPYVIDHDGLLRVKLLYRLPGGGLRIRSYNREEYPDETLDETWPEKIEIKGRVFWSSTMW